MEHNRTIRSRRARRKGVILIICLWLLAALSLLALGLAFRLRLESRIIRYRARREEMLALARAAVALAAARIEASAEGVTFHGQDWGRPITLAEADFGGLGITNLQKYDVKALVFDELGRLNVNSAYRAQLRLLPCMDDELVSAIIDWRDEDDIVSPMGAESVFYGTLVPPRRAKNRVFDSSYELLLVRGVTEPLFFGAEGNIITVPDETGAWIPPAPGLRDWLTVYGNGRINLNTAPFEVLLTIPGVTEEMAQNIIYRRSGADGAERTADDVAFESFEQLKDIGGLTEFARRQIEANCVVSSPFFSVRVHVAERRSSAAVKTDAAINRSAKKGAICVSWREI